MTFRSVLIGRVHIVRWKKPEIPDILTINREVHDAAERLREKVIGISIVPQGAEPPADDTRAAMSNNLPELLKDAETLHFIMEGSGFRLSIMRSILSGAIVLKGERGKISVHSTFDEALQRIGTRIGMRKDEFLRKVNESTILTTEKVRK